MSAFSYVQKIQVCAIACAFMEGCTFMNLIDTNTTDKLQHVFRYLSWGQWNVLIFLKLNDFFERDYFNVLIFFLDANSFLGNFQWNSYQ